MLSVRAILVTKVPSPAFLTVWPVHQSPLTGNILQQFKVLIENHEIIEFHAASVLTSSSSKFKEGKGNAKKFYKRSTCEADSNQNHLFRACYRQEANKA